MTLKQFKLHSMLKMKRIERFDFILAKIFMEGEDKIDENSYHFLYQDLETTREGIGNELPQ